MENDSLLIEMKLRTDFNKLARISRELAEELLVDFQTFSAQPDIKNPADAPEKYHSVFYDTVKSYLNDLDCSGDW